MASTQYSHWCRKSKESRSLNSKWWNMFAAEGFYWSIESAQGSVFSTGRTLYSLSSHRGNVGGAVHQLQALNDADAGNDSTRASATLTYGYKVRVPRPSLRPLLSLTLHLDAARPPRPSPRSPPSRSPAIASAAVHAHTAAHRKHINSTQSPRTAIVPSPDAPVSTIPLVSTLTLPSFPRRSPPSRTPSCHARTAPARTPSTRVQAAPSSRSGSRYVCTSPLSLVSTLTYPTSPLSPLSPVSPPLPRSPSHPPAHRGLYR
ncbi:hypothetical protein B0H16DRAFT_1817016 [Mycena metata]|uniref:Uncharacterized protein n=1 Tax=Mycena metata TaxID=1033252 RepID=A0AAD7MD87_9AGAR|nr:hypothetical protein B0H16DRAFT_1817016 [Mycena metata]